MATRYGRIDPAIDTIRRMRHRTIVPEEDTVRPRSAAVTLLATALASCQYVQPSRYTRGNMAEEYEYSQLVPGTSTKADATSLLGSPTTHDTFDDNTWLYIGELTQPVIASYPAIDRQQVIVLRFDNNGTLRALRRLTGKDAVRVAMAGGSTPSPGSEATILQQVIGNVGRYNPAGLLGGSNSGTGGLNGTAGGEGGTGNTLP